MQTKIENGNLVITIPLHTPRPSASGKTLVVASTSGNKVTEAIVDGKPVTIGLNAYIKRSHDGRKKMAHLEYRSNNAYDSILLVDEATGLVRSDWTVNERVMRDFCDCTQDASDWDDQLGDERKADKYGDLLAIRRGYTLEAINADAWVGRVQFAVR